MELRSGMGVMTGAIIGINSAVKAIHQQYKTRRLELNPSRTAIFAVNVVLDESTAKSAWKRRHKHTSKPCAKCSLKCGACSARMERFG